MNIEKIEKDLLTDPLSMLGGYKLQYISEVLSNYPISNFLEIGTWLGGSTHILSKKFPGINFHTIDINDYSEMYANNQSLVKMIENRLECSVGPEHIESIQNFYKKNSPNSTFYKLNDFSWQENKYDAILVDGDHTLDGLQKDLTNCYKSIRHKGFIFIDDISFPYLKKATKQFFTKRNQKVCFYSLEVGKDLAMIRVNRKKTVVMKKR